MGSDNFYKTATAAGGDFTFAHPFKIDIRVKVEKNGETTYVAAVNYHSRLFEGLTLKDNWLNYDRLNIEGLDFEEPLPDSFNPSTGQSKNYYCVLEITIQNLQAKTAKIVWVESDKSEEELAPVTFESTENLKQTYARIILGVCVADDEAEAGLPGNDAATKTPYVMQHINTNLIMCNMVFDGIPIIYPVPFGGGRLNF